MGKWYSINEKINSPELFVVQDDGKKLGILSREDALRLAKDQEKDLVEIVPQAKPPVAKIIEWSKFKYDQQKKKKAQKSKSQEQKELWFKANIEEGDINHKLKKVEEFIKKGQRVKLTVRRKGRVPKERFIALMEILLSKTEEYADVLTPAKFEGGNYAAVVGPKK
ncbi:MAG: translation initiation factor IF-3 [Candidatus Dojkabacteria bacterium]